MAREILFTPWRMNYISSHPKKSEGCVFCAVLSTPAKDREKYVLFRGPTTFAMMNIYPYNTGHMMVLPNRHVSTLAGLSGACRAEMMNLVSYLTSLITDLMQPDAFNIGLNLGRAAGAGIDSHLHMHVVPRWNGDSNFMSVVGNTRVLPETLDDTYTRILTALEKEPPEL